MFPQYFLNLLFFFVLFSSFNHFLQITLSSFLSIFPADYLPLFAFDIFFQSFYTFHYIIYLLFSSFLEFFFSLWYLPTFLSSFLLSFVGSKRAIILSSISHTFSHLYSKTNPLLLSSCF